VIFYGHFTGESSYPVVCQAILRELRRHGVEVETCDFRDPRSSDLAMQVRAHASELEEAIARGVIPDPPELPREMLDQPALVLGFPTWLFSVPRHVRLVAYVVGDVKPIPQLWTAAIESRAHEVVTPSRWMIDRLREAEVEKPITVVHHGIDPMIFYPGEPREREGIVARHFSTAFGGRKGTDELIRALALAEPGLPDGFRVEMHVQPQVAPLVATEVAKRELDGIVEIVPEETSRGQAELATILRDFTDLLLAPSRAEGFGMIPLEAVACGVPVVMTGSTGHAEHIADIRDAVVEVPTGDMVACEPFPGLAPAVDVHDLCGCLHDAVARLDELTRTARDISPRVQEAWSWETVLRPLVKMFE
jgi:glycosyltransferase involved in cell wall biosynthesis